MRILIILFFFSSMVQAQNLEQHQWKHRVIVISGNTENLDEVEEQFKRFQTKKEELLERKLVIYKCLKNTCSYYNWVSEPKNIKLKNQPQEFEIKLHGLDGGEKFHSEKLITSKQIFDLINSMPMRKTQIRTKNK